jgi:hypothetical protein
MIKSIMGWEPSTPLVEGMRKTYEWIEEQYRLRQAGTKTEFPAATPDLGPLTNLEPVQARPMVMAPES